MEFRFVSERAKREFIDLPVEVRNRMGASLTAVARDQGGLPDDQYTEGDGITTKALKLGKLKGVIQLSRNGSPAYRVVYCAKYGDRLYVLHSFSKTTDGVDHEAMEVVKQRYKEMLDALRKDGFVV